MPHRSDESLFAAFQQHRDCQALGILFHRRADELLRLAVFLAPRPTDAEDLVQATFLSAIAHAESFRAGNRVMSWLCGILTNHARMLRRAERRTAPNPGLASAPDAAAATLHAELRQALTAGIAALPEPYRSVLSLHLEGGLDSAEISQRLSRPAATVRKQMERALDRLRTALPIGLATGLAVHVDAQSLAANAADAARFVEAEPSAAIVPAATSTHGASALAGWWLWSGLAALLTIAVVAAWPATATPLLPPAGALLAAPADLPAPLLVPTVAPSLHNLAQEREADLAVAELEVRVVQPDGTTAADVTVLLVDDSGKALPERILAGLARTTTTDAGGAATFRAVPPGDYELAWPGSVGRRKLRLTPGPHQVELELAAPIAFRGVVVDQFQRPVADAEIVVSETSLRGDLGSVVARSRSDGSFAATAQLSHGRVFARHEGYRSSVGARLEPSTSMLLSLPPAQRELVVTVLDPQGRPVPDAYVAVVPRSAALNFLPPEHARTDAAGRCFCRDPGPGEASVIASRDGLAPAAANLDPDATALTLTLRHGTSLRGTLYDADGTPMVGTRVHVAFCEHRSNEPVAPLLARSLRTDARGGFWFHNVPLGTVHVQAFGEVPSSGRGLPPYPWLLAAADIHVADPAGHELVLHGKRGPILRGRLLTADGKPVADHNVVATPRQGTAIHRVFRVRGAGTAADGSFAIHGLAADEDYDLGAYLPGGPGGTGTEFPVANGTGRPGAAPTILRLPGRMPTSMLRVAVLGPDGHPIPETSLELRTMALQLPKSATVAADGSAQFGPLLEGDYQLAVIAPGLGTRVMAVTIGDDPADVDLGVITLPLPARLTVQLARPGGRPRPGLRGVARGRIGDKFVSATADAHGFAALPPLPPGDVEVLVLGPGIAPHRTQTTLRSGAQQIELQLEPATTAALEFEFALADNPFVVNGPLHVRVRAEDGSLEFEEHIGAETSRGRFDFATGLPPGRYDIVARALWNAAAQTTLTVPPHGDVLPQRLVLRR